MRFSPGAGRPNPDAKVAASRSDAFCGTAPKPVAVVSALAVLAPPLAASRRTGARTALRHTVPRWAAGTGGFAGSTAGASDRAARTGRIAASWRIASARRLRFRWRIAVWFPASPAASLGRESGGIDPIHRIASRIPVEVRVTAIKTDWVRRRPSTGGRVIIACTEEQETRARIAQAAGETDRQRGWGCFTHSIAPRVVRDDVGHRTRTRIDDQPRASDRICDDSINHSRALDERQIAGIVVTEHTGNAPGRVELRGERAVRAVQETVNKPAAHATADSSAFSIY